MPNPISSLTLYNCKLERSGHKTIDFSSAAARDSYFSSSNALATITHTAFNGNATYIREHDVITVGINADVLDAAGVNYCRFINPQAGNFFRYCFIDQVEYVAPETSRLHIRIDAFVNNIGSINYNQCFVEREHVANDTRGLHTLPEDIPHENMVCNSVLYDMVSSISARTENVFNSHYLAAIFMTEPVFTSEGNYDGFIGGNANCAYIIAPEQVADLGKFVEYLTDINKANAIIGIIPLLRGLTDVTEVNIPPDVATEIGTNKVYLISDGSNSETSLSIYSSFTTLDGYTPHNNKLFTYPFNYMELESSSGQNAIIEYEKIGSTYNFNQTYSATLSPTLTVTPVHYNGESNSIAKVVSFSQWSPIAYNIDTFSQWYAQNKNVVDMTLYMKAGNIVKSGIGALGAKSYAQAGSSAIQVLDSTAGAMEWLASIKDMQRRPDEMKGTLCGNAALYAAKGGIKILDMCIKAEYAELIDRYFDMFGYNVSLNKTPQVSSRVHYNYCKTIGSNVYGAIAEDQKEMIDRLFNDGITVWHMSSGATYGVYDTSNSIA